jgi:hypothetical protein
MGMRHYRPRARSDRSYFGGPSYLDIQKHIGKSLREQYELPKDLPHSLLMLLIQIDNAEDDREE